ncbi:LacI family DNA-binding transcriptional regulator [Microcella sp.]|uniref:LacI family DNA-binding transcriptional regulator n=1 Tax=Microcella sp. TaxID=1913979 RepID=UPI00299F6B03|nr:LacI family DNA-binding transcriptional regulator [Microcella sp.]MDX2026404.1 LacI family DNA-binding transcriptional regulator [Microcella sp.]
MKGSPASMRDVAERAGVSIGTVSNVLNRPDKVSSATARKVLAVIDELGFVRNDAARQLRAGSSRAIGLIVLDVRNPFFSELAIGAEDGARESGYSIILGNSDEKTEREAGYLDLFEEQRMRGVLITPFGDVETRLRRLRERGIPAVLVDRTSSSGDVSSVSVDDVAGGRLAGQHLVAIGRRRIAFVGGPLNIRQVQDRLLGLQQVAQQHDDVRVEIITGSSLSILEGRRLGEQLAARGPGDRPDAVFAANDLMAIGVLQAFVMLGSMHVPDDIAIVGYDDIDFARGAVVPLTSVRQPASLIGRTAVEMLLAEADDGVEPGRQVVFTPELIVRASSRR